MNTNTYVDRPNDKGTALDRERQLATLLEDDDVLCAHVYDDSGYSEFLFHGSPENIANFIGARPMVHQIVLTDRQERPVLWTIGYFIDRCPDKVLLEKVKKELQRLPPVQLREDLGVQLLLQHGQCATHSLRFSSASVCVWFS